MYCTLVIRIEYCHVRYAVSRFVFLKDFVLERVHKAFFGAFLLAQQRTTLDVWLPAVPKLFSDWTKGERSFLIVQPQRQVLSGVSEKGSQSFFAEQVQREKTAHVHRLNVIANNEVAYNSSSFDKAACIMARLHDVIVILAYENTKAIIFLSQLLAKFETWHLYTHLPNYIHQNENRRMRFVVD